MLYFKGWGKSIYAQKMLPGGRNNPLSRSPNGIHTEASYLVTVKVKLGNISIDYR